MTTTNLTVKIARPFREFLNPHRYKIAYGGRGSGKSWTAADLLVLMAYQRPLRILCARELQLSISESVHRLIADSIERRGLSSFYTVEKATIYGPNGSQFLFAGIKNNVTKIKSMEGIDICWVEEAEAVSAHSWNVLIPTIRKEGSEIWATFNPGNILDETYQRFVVSPPPDAYVVKVNYNDNPWFPPVLRREMEAMRETDPELARHVWDGEPVADSALAIIKPEWIAAAVDAHKVLNLDTSGGVIGGFDVADEGADANALIFRRGILAYSAEEWKDRDPNSAARHTFMRSLQERADAVYFDNIGVGAGAKGAIREELDRLDNKARPAEFRGFNAAAAVQNPHHEYMPGKTNKDMFYNLKAQAWWTLGDRFRNTWLAVNGKPHDADQLISLAGDLPHLDKLRAELSQPRREFLNGKFRVESKKDMAARGVKSPNLADALVMAYAPEVNSFDLSALL